MLSPAGIEVGSVTDASWSRSSVATPATLSTALSVNTLAWNAQILDRSTRATFQPSLKNAAPVVIAS
jgi:hypothetical protein